MLVSSIIDEARETLGRQGDDAFVFKRISDAVRLANTQVQNSANTGTFDLCVCNGCVTLPAFVGAVLAVNVDGRPGVIRNEWFEFNVSGPGTTSWVPCGYADERGQFSTFRDPSGPVKLVAVVESAADSNKMLRVFGWDANGKRIYTEGPGGILEDGIAVPTVFGYSLPHPTAPAIARIDRVDKAITNGFVKLIAVDPVTGASHTLIGYYNPWETQPIYRRLRVLDRSWLRVKYSKTDLEVRGINDWIALENREALMLLLKAVAFRKQNQYAVAQSAEAEALRLLRNDKKAQEPPGLSVPQIIDNSYPYCQNEGLIY